MKNFLFILITLFCLQGQSVYSQVKKTQPRTSSKSPVKKKTVVTKASTQPMANTQPIAPPKETIIPKKVSVEQTASNSYKAALGLKFIYGLSLTGKVFLKESSALEGILRYNTAGGEGTNIAFSGLYEYHNEIKDVAGLLWYLGGGGHVNYFSWKYDEADPVTTFGVVGILGLEYKFNNLPIAISADWQPGYILSNGIGFSAENGGIGVKYTF